MNIGRMNKRVSIYSVTSTRDSRGAYETSYDIVGTYWAEVKILKMVEKYKDDQVTTPADGIARIRFNRNITAEMIIRFDSVDYRIVSAIDVDGKHKETEILFKKD